MTDRRTDISTGQRLVLVGAVAGVLACSTTAFGQNMNNCPTESGPPNQFGAQLRADAASKMIVLGVQQGISSLPPTSGQSFTYDFDEILATYVPSELLGPTALRSPQAIGAHKFSVRLAASYFKLSDSKDPIPYQVNNAAGAPYAVAAFGLKANAYVGLVNLGGNYGVTDRVEVTLNVPVVTVNASASQTFSTRTNALNLPPSEAPVSAEPVFDGDVAGAVARLNEDLQPGGPLSLRTDSFNSLGFNFNEGTHVGVGRISVGAKGVLYADKVVQIAFAPEFFCPSPNQDQFAGSNSPAILPRFIVAARVKDVDALRLHVDAGYDYDFDNNTLRRFVWNGGLSYAIKGATFDAGVGGSTFNEGIEWTPNSAPFVDQAGNAGTIHALGSNRLGRTFVDGLGGVKVRVASKTVLSGSVNVPLNSEGFRAAAVGTLAVEQYF